MKFNKLVKEFEKSGHYLQDLGDENYLNRYRFTSMYEDDKGIQITKNHTHTLEDLERILKLLTVRRLGKYEVGVVKLILNDESIEEFSKLMTEMEKDFNIPALNDPEWNERNRDIIHLYKLISDYREVDQEEFNRDMEDDWEMEI